MNIELLDLLVTSSGLLLLVCFWTILWQPFAHDRLRQDLFDLRDELFDKVWASRYGLTFDSPVYVRSRMDLNSMIRFAHHVAFMRCVLVGFFFHRSFSIDRKKADEFRESLSEEHYKVLKWVDRRQTTALSRFFYHSSPAFWCLALIFASILLVVSAVLVLFRGAFACKTLFNAHFMNPAIENIEYQSGQRTLLGTVHA